MKVKNLVEEVCNSCLFYSFCTNIELPYCDGKDYVENVSKMKIRRGDRAGEAFSGTDGIIADIQYEHDRYQFKHISGWRYGIENIVKLN